MLDKWVDLDTDASWEKIDEVIQLVNTGEQSCFVSIQLWDNLCILSILYGNNRYITGTRSCMVLIYHKIVIFKWLKKFVVRDLENDIFENEAGIQLHSYHCYSDILKLFKNASQFQNLCKYSHSNITVYTVILYFCSQQSQLAK